MDKKIQLTEFERLFEIVKKVNGRYALVSKKTGRPLAYYKGPKGEYPSKDWISKQERRIQAFKHMNEMENHLVKLLESIKEFKKVI